MAVGLSDERVADRDVLDDAFDLIDFDVIANGEGLSEQNQHACKKVFKNIFEGKSYRHGAEPQSCDQAARLDTWEQHYGGHRQACSPYANGDELTDS